MKQLSLVVVFACFTFVVTAQINCPPNLPLTLLGNTEYCVGMPGSQLSVEETYDQYEWLPTTESSQSVLLTAGNYQLVVTHYTGCTDTLDIEVEQVSNPPQPTVTASGPTEFCAGGSVTLSGPSGYPYYEWSSGSVSEQITVYESITVTLSIVDWIGCSSSSNSIDVIVNPLPTAIVSPDINGYDVEFNNLSINATDYEWNFGDGSMSTDFEPAHTYSLDGAVDMYLVAMNDCGTDTAYLDLTSVDIEGVDPFNEVSIYPNPTSGTVNVNLDNMTQYDLNVTVFSMDGARVLSSRFSGGGDASMFLDLDHLPNGFYILQLESGNSSVYRTIQLLGN